MSLPDQIFLTAKIGEAVIVKHFLKSYTHFVISVEFSGFSSAPQKENNAVYPIAPYHANVKLRRKTRQLCEWSFDTHVERRYSELVDLRTYLTLSYPMLIFPPLPAKSSVDNINTTLASEVHLSEQRRSIRRFLSELLLMNDVVFYDAHVVEALQVQHAAYVEDGLVALRADLASLIAAQAHIDDYKSLHQRTSGTIPTALVETTNKALRGLFSYVSGGTSVNPFIESAKSSLNCDATYTRWVPILQHVRELSISLLKSSEEFLKAMIPLDEMNVASLNIPGSMADYDRILSASNGFGLLVRDVAEFSQFFSCIGNAHVSDCDLIRSKVIELIKFESAWMASAEAAVEYLLALFVHVATLTSDPYRCGSAETANYKKFLDSMRVGLERAIKNVTGPAHKKRMSLVLANFFKINIGSIERENNNIEATSYFRRRLGPNKQSDEDDWEEQMQNLPWVISNTK